MGCMLIMSSCSDDSETRGGSYADRLVGNPDPYNFRIESVEKIGNLLLVGVTYPDAKNFEGRKILVFKDISENELRKLDKLDPHFCGGKHPSPIARFRPTVKGWEAAIIFCEAMVNRKRRRR